MAKLYNVQDTKKNRIKRNKARNDRFYSNLDMSIIKHDAAVRNAQIMRGEIKDEPNNYISKCGCGGVGCFIHGSFETKVDEDYYRGGKGIDILVNKKSGFGMDYGNNQRITPND